MNETIHKNYFCTRCGEECDEHHNCPDVTILEDFDVLYNLPEDIKEKDDTASGSDKRLF